MPTLTITRGLPGSGKSTYARTWVGADRAHRARVNRDDLRAMVDAGVFEKGVTEPRILAARDALVSGLLRKGLDVVVDDTNLPQRAARDLAKLAGRAGASFRVEDFTGVPLETCVERDAARLDKAPVGEAVIRDMHTRYLAGRSLPLPLPEEPASGHGELVPYTPKPGTPKAVLVDIDGTLALHGARSPFDESRVHEDRLNEPVAAVVRALAAGGWLLVFVSGRTDTCRAATEAWLAGHLGVRRPPLHMRKAGDGREDPVVKAEIFNRLIRDHYDVTCVIDDRVRVVAMWRSLGLCVLQCAEGDF